MRFAIVLFLLTLSVALAEPRYESFEVNHVNTSTNILTETKNPRGYIEEILIQAPSQAGVTANVTFVISPDVGSGLTKTVLYTNATLTAAARAMTRIVPTDNTGGALASLTVAERYLSNGDQLTFRVVQSSAVTNVSFKAWVKISQ
jgi:hypothetical protein